MSDHAIRCEPVLLGMRFRALTLEDAVKTAIAEWSQRDGRGRVYRFLNAYTIALAETDQSYRQVLLRSNLNHPDGRPLAPVLNAIHRGASYHHVRGPDFFEHALVQGCSAGVRHFFLGGSERTLPILLNKVRALAPESEIVGAYSPPFGERTAEELGVQDSLIRGAQPDIVWVGLGTPKQDFEAERIATEFGLCVAAVGAAFDFTAGTKRAAPPLLRLLWLEWLYRLLTEPRRLLWRYIWGNTRFTIAAMRAIVRARGQGVHARSTAGGS